jgi:hypothetical protein
MLFELPESSGTFSERVQKMVDDIVKKGAEGCCTEQIHSITVVEAMTCLN